MSTILPLRVLGRYRHVWKDNVKMGVKGIWCELDSSSSVYGPMAGSCEHGMNNEVRVSYKAEHFLTICPTLIR
jgi:hypothetical protein